MNTIKSTIPLLLSLICGSAAADVIPFLGVAQQFAVLGAETVTNTNSTTLHGDLGVSPGTSITGLDSITFASGGVVHQTDAIASQAQYDARASYNGLAAVLGGIDLSGSDLGAVGTLSAGVYRFASEAQLTGTLTLDFANDPNGVFIFQIGSKLTTASNSIVNVLNGTSSNGVYFQVGSSANLGDNSIFAGNILAQQSITFNSAAGIACGRALALTAEVTLIGNTISNDCSAYAGSTAYTDFGSNGFSGIGGLALEPMPPAEVPEPGALALFGLGLCTLAVPRLRRRRALEAGAAV